MPQKDKQWMQLALDQAKNGIGTTHPNPRVGAVIVRDGVVLGKGYHHQCGADHAEVDALKNVTESVDGATMYVTLEPCAAIGRTPACTSAILSAGIKRLVFASADPNPKMAGGGKDLEQAGIEVVSGVCVEEADALNRSFFHVVKTGLPWVIAKAAISLDGKLATYSHHSQWISGEGSRKHAHALRAECDAVVIGVGTLLYDDPALTVRHAKLLGEQPIRVVMANEAPEPIENCQLLSSEAKSRIYITKESGNAQLWRDLGMEVICCTDLRACFKHLADDGCLQVLVEGGGKMHAACFEAELSREVVIYQAPILIGGTDSVNLWHGLGVEKVDRALKLENIQHEQLGDDMLIRGDIIYPA